MVRKNLCFFCTQTTGIMENDGPEPGSQPVAVAEITATPAQAQQGKKQLSEAQKAGLAKAREKAREKKLAASKQKSDMEKADAEKEEDERKKAQAYIHSQIAEQSAAAKAALEQEEAKEKPISDDDIAYTRLKRSAFHSIFTPDEQRLRTTQRVSSHLDVALPILLLGLVVHLRCSSEPTIQIIRNGCQYAEISSQIGMDRVQTGRRSFVGDDSLLCSCVIEHGSALL